MTSREQVFDAINGERDYQDAIWGPTDSQGKHSILEFLAYMQDYVRVAMHTCSRNSDAEIKDKVLHEIRKITAMGVSCLEQHGAPKRALEVHNEQD